VIVLSSIFFVVSKRAKEPRLEFSLSDYAKEPGVESAIFEILDKSFIADERPDSWTNGQVAKATEEFNYFKCQPKYLPLLDMTNLLPLEASLNFKDKKIPFIEKDRLNREDISWNFALDEKEKLYQFDASEMTYDAPDSYQILPDRGGVRFYINCTISKVVELPSGIKEFRIRAANESSPAVPTENFDPSAHIVLTLDNNTIREFYLKGGKPIVYNAQHYAGEGWHKVGIEFDNKVHYKLGGRDFSRNLLLKDLEIYNLSGNLYLKIKKDLRQQHPLGDCSFSYLRTLPKEEENDLVRIFKRRFNIDNFSQIIKRGPDVKALLSNIEIASVIKPAIFAPPPTKITWRLKVPVYGMGLRVGFGIIEEAWDKTGDGVVFSIKAKDEKNEEDIELLSKYINPKVNRQERKWFQETLDLTRFKGREILLVFETSGSVASPIKKEVDTSYDYAIWSQ
jgi:hypothetical protein